MKRNHLFASAAIATALIVTLPAQAQILGGGLNGAVHGMPPSAVGSGFASFRGVNSTDLSASGQAATRVDGLGRVDRTAVASAHEAGRDAGRAKADATRAGRQAVGAGEAEVSKADTAARGTARAVTQTAAAATVTAAAEGGAQTRNLDSTAGVAGGLSSTKPPATTPHTGGSEPSLNQPVTTKKPETPRDIPPASGTEANASASANASATH